MAARKAVVFISSLDESLTRVAVYISLLTFILSWREQSEGCKLLAFYTCICDPDSRFRSTDMIFSLLLILVYFLPNFWEIDAQCCLYFVGCNAIEALLDAHCLLHKNMFFPSTNFPADIFTVRLLLDQVIRCFLTVECIYLTFVCIFHFPETMTFLYFMASPDS